MSEPTESTTPTSGTPPAPRIATSRSSTARTAATLISQYTAVPTENNSDTGLVYIEISAAKLYSTYANTLKPIVYGNFRNIGARTLTDQADRNLLDNVILTVATNAVIATYAVCHTKACKLNAGAISLFGNYSPVDCTRFPALTSLLINSIGPVEAPALPYRCTFVPYIVWDNVHDLITQANYTSHLYELFIQAMKRGKTVAMSDVDVSNNQSNHWWTLFMSNVQTTTTGATTRTGDITAFCPFSFADRDHAVILAAFVIEETLYDVPGPLVTATVGPFARMYPPTSVEDIPDVYRTSLAVNPHVPAIFATFTKVSNMSHASAVTFGILQNDSNISDLAFETVTLGPAPEYDYPVDYSITNPSKKRKTSEKASAKSTSMTTRSGLATDTIESTPAALYIATVYYFDHRLLDKVPIARRSTVVTQANQLE
ncbi:hypothetical protein RVD_032 [Diatom colony associated dsRNA virus 14]|nr:hypothetical protein RVD_032 [Diatom colony associated dsRNA virus 14]